MLLGSEIGLQKSSKALQKPPQSTRFSELAVSSAVHLLTKCERVLFTY